MCFNQLNGVNDFFTFGDICSRVYINRMNSKQITAYFSGKLRLINYEQPQMISTHLITWILIC